MQTVALCPQGAGEGGEETERRRDAVGSDCRAGRSSAGLQGPEAIPGEPRAAQPALSAAGRAGCRAAVVAQCPSAGLRLPHQPYRIEVGPQRLHHVHSDGTGLRPLQVPHHISEDPQGLHCKRCIVVPEEVHQVRQEAINFSGLQERQSFHWMRSSLPGQLARQPPGPTLAGRAFGAVSPHPDAQHRPLPHSQPQSPAANTAPPDTALLTISALSDSVMRALSTRESIWVSLKVRNLQYLYMGAKSSSDTSWEASS